MMNIRYLFLLTLAAASFLPVTLASQMISRRSPCFIENRGQWGNQRGYRAQLASGDLWVSDGALLYDIHSGEVGGHRQGDLLRFSFAQQGATPRALGTSLVPGVSNFFSGDDPSRWYTNIPRYNELRLQGIARGVDVRIALERGIPRYDLLLAAGRNPSSIVLRCDGAKSIRIDPQGDLVIATSRGTVRQSDLAAYQIINGERRSVDCSFLLDARRNIRFRTGDYDQRYPLVIDPLIYATYIGTNQNDAIEGITTGPDGSIYFCGYTNFSTFPTSVGAYDRTQNGGVDAVVGRINPGTGDLMFATYLGGTGNDTAKAIAVDKLGNAYVTGAATASSFPIAPNAYDASLNGGTDCFLSKLNPTGTTLIYSTYIGGSGTEEGLAIAVNDSLQPYIAGYSSSTNYPTFASSYSRYRTGGNDAIITKFSSDGSRLLYSTYLGGTLSDVANGITIAPDQTAYVCGTTTSTNFPTTTNVIGTSLHGAGDGFVTAINSLGTLLGYSTYVGGNGLDEARGIARNVIGEIYVCGSTTSTDLPTDAGTSLDRSYNGNGDGFLALVNTGATAFYYYTYLGGAGSDEARSVYVNAKGLPVVIGSTASSGFPTTPRGFDTSYNGGGDAFAVVIDGTGAGLSYGTFFGGSGLDEGRAATVDPQGNIFLAGATYSSDIPISSNAIDATFNGGNTKEDGFIAEVNAATLTLTAPVGGEYWCANTTQRFTWTATDVDSIRIEISDDEGFSFKPLSPKILASLGKWDWAIPEDQQYGFFYQFRIVDAKNLSLADTTDSSMTIDFATTIIGGVEDQQVCPNGTIFLTVVAFGQDPTYQWKKNGTNIPGATADTLVIPSAKASDSGDYSVVVTGSCNETVTSRTAHVTVGAGVTTLTNPPAAQILCKGDSLRLTVGARGSSIRYQWRHNGTDIPGATDTLLSVASVGVSDSGVYDVVITSSCAAPLTTPPVTVTVNRATSIIAQPITQKVKQGDSTSFSVTADGSGLSYQWRHDGVDIPGATAQSYTIASVSEADTGSYDVVVKGLCGTDATSLVAKLSIERPVSVPVGPGLPSEMDLTELFFPKR